MTVGGCLRAVEATGCPRPALPAQACDLLRSWVAGHPGSSTAPRSVASTILQYHMRCVLARTFAQVRAQTNRVSAIEWEMGCAALSGVAPIAATSRAPGFTLGSLTRGHRRPCGPPAATHRGSRRAPNTLAQGSTAGHASAVAH